MSVHKIYYSLINSTYIETLVNHCDLEKQKNETFLIKIEILEFFSWFVSSNYIGAFYSDESSKCIETLKKENNQNYARHLAESWSSETNMVEWSWLRLLGGIDGNKKNANEILLTFIKYKKYE